MQKQSMETFIYLIIVIGIGAFLLIYLINSNATNIQNNERIAVFRGTEFLKILGPGRHYKFPYNLEYWQKIRIDEEGIYQKNSTVKFNEFEIPVEDTNELKNGDVVYIKSFNEEKIILKKIHA